MYCTNCGAVCTPTEKIQEILAKYNNRENMYITE